MKKIWPIAMLTFAVVSCGCSRQREPTQTSTELPQLPQQLSPSPSMMAAQDPLHEFTPDNFKSKWKTFTKDGRYRMAQSREVTGKPYHYSWSDDVLVIVVDITQSDNSSRLKLAYFKAPKDNNGSYRLHWVDHNFDLSKCRVSNASPDLVLYEGGDPATRSAFLEWDAKRQKYTCLTKSL